MGNIIYKFFKFIFYTIIVVAFVGGGLLISLPLGWIFGTLSNINVTLMRVLVFMFYSFSMYSTFVNGSSSDSSMLKTLTGCYIIKKLFK